jgi:predicted O-linked N-acetylglucosamine transferase (SPINDLY family)
MAEHADPQTLFDTALTAHRQGRIAEAEAGYRRILDSDPGHVNALNLLGVLLGQRGRAPEGLPLLARAAALAPASLAVRFNLAGALLDLERLAEAEAELRRCVCLAPHDANLWNRLGSALARRHRLDDGIAALRRATLLARHDAGILVNLGAALLEAGRRTEGGRVLRQAVMLAPDGVAALANLGALLQRQRDSEAAEPWLRRTLRLAPGVAEAWNTLGDALREQDRPEEAQAAFSQALALRPGFTPARLNRALATLPVTYGDEAEIDRRRAAYAAALDQLDAWADGLDQAGRAEAGEAVGACQPFALPYQGRDDRALQQQYGRLMVRLSAACFPAYARRPEMPPPAADGRIRVGFASAYLRRHSVWRPITRGLLGGLDRSRFAVHGYQLGADRDLETDWAEQRCDVFQAGARSAADWAGRIAADRLHVLIYPEVGMDPLTARLATLRLAPVQCVSWGHPETSGLPTIDYYLSAERFEPPGAEAHYSETLVRLAALASVYDPPPPPAPALPRAALGLPDGVLYLCPQTLFKYLPDYDARIVAIARQVPGSRFLFFTHPTTPAITRRFATRIAAAFAAAGLRWEDHGLILPRQDAGRFQQVMQAADIYLDSIGFSGFNTAIEALACGLPVVTVRGPFMRGRLASGLLEQIDVAETVAETADDFTAIAIRLGRDPGWRAAVTARVTANLPRAYGDPAPLRTLERFLVDAVAA